MGRARGKPTGQSSTQWQADLHFDSSLGGGWRWRQLNSEVAPLKKSVRQPGHADPKTGIRPTDVSWTGALRPSGAPSTAILGSLVRPGSGGAPFLLAGPLHSDPESVRGLPSSWPVLALPHAPFRSDGCVRGTLDSESSAYRNSVDNNL
jgi:hypothetical protein